MPSRKPVLDLTVDPERAERLLETEARALERRTARRGEAVASRSSDITNPQSHEAKTPGMRGVPRIRERDGVEMRQTTLHLPVSLFRRLSRHCADTDQGMSEVIARAVDQHLKGEGAP